MTTSLDMQPLARLSRLFQFETQPIENIDNLGSGLEGYHSRWARIKPVSTHNYSTIQLPTVSNTVIDVRRPGIQEGVYIDIYPKLGVNYQNLAIIKKQGMSVAKFSIISTIF